MTKGKEWRCSSFELPKRKKREKNHMNKTKNETKFKKKNKTEEEGRDLFFFFPVWKVNLGRDNRMRKILNVGVFVFVRVQVCLARRYREKYLRNRKKDSDDCLRLHFPSLFFFPPFGLIARTAKYYTRNVYVACRTSASGFVWCCVCVRTRGCKYNN